MLVADPIIKQIALMHFHHEKYHRRYYMTVLQDDRNKHHIHRLRLPSRRPESKYEPVDLNIVDFANRDCTSLLYRE